MGTTIVGSTIGSLTNTTGTEIASGIQSSKVQPDALNLESGSFVPNAPRAWPFAWTPPVRRPPPRKTTHLGDARPPL
jgi:hypothetical protein